MKITPTKISDVLLLEPRVFGDERGYFYEGWNSKCAEERGISRNFVQDNFSHSRKGILRGLHFQIVRPQAKLIWVNRGEIFDVAVDLRPDSPTCGKWLGITLSSKNHHRLFIPEGFAHGFLVLTETADVCYKVSDFWHPEGERALRWDDAEVGIEWPIDLTGPPLLNTRDAAAASFSECCKMIISG